MEKKINRTFLLVALVSIIATLCLSMSVFFESLKEQIIADLKIHGSIIKATQGWQETEKITNDEGIRITLIDIDGTVLFDNIANYKDMENHNNRMEVLEARELGESSVIRKSSTFSNVSNYYYAMCLDDQRILRISKEVKSFNSIFMNLIPMVVGLSFIIIVFVIMLSRFLVKSIMKPMRIMAQNGDYSQEGYKELGPFIEKIKSQHIDIAKQTKVRQDFMTNITHELKTPLTSISGYAELIETGMASNNDIKHFAHEIHRSSSRLVRTINDIIRLSELDSEIIEVFEDVDLYDICEECVSSLSINAEKYQVSLYLHGQSEVVHANKDCMIELIYNLVDNAIRYNKQNGRVDIMVSRDAQGTYLKVKDNGIGIPEKYHERVFERFYRVDKSRSKATGGTGLGLAIVKHIVSNHKAVLDIQSEEGLGTEITVYFNDEF